MVEKCNKCGAPLEGFFAKTLGRLLGVKLSEKKEGYCNKCEDEIEEGELEENGNIDDDAEQQTLE